MTCPFPIQLKRSIIGRYSEKRRWAAAKQPHRYWCIFTHSDERKYDPYNSRAEGIGALHD
jgi:hypothetical protein